MYPVVVRSVAGDQKGRETDQRQKIIGCKVVVSVITFIFQRHVGRLLSHQTVLGQGSQVANYKQTIKEEIPLVPHAARPH